MRVLGVVGRVHDMGMRGVLWSLVGLGRMGYKNKFSQVVVDKVSHSHFLVIVFILSVLPFRLSSRRNYHSHFLLAVISLPCPLHNILVIFPPSCDKFFTTCFVL
jgi:hypothetical protein